MTTTFHLSRTQASSILRKVILVTQIKSSRKYSNNTTTEDLADNARVAKQIQGVTDPYSISRDINSEPNLLNWVEYFLRDVRFKSFSR